MHHYTALMKEIRHYLLNRVVMNVHPKQKELDKLEYPTTHTYLIQSMEPTGVLKDRVNVMENIINHHCVERQHAFEIGFNKGFLLYFLSQKFKQVDGCEPRDVCYQFVESIREEKLDRVKILKNSSFKEFPWISPRKYDCIVLANCLHYVYQEYGDFSFLHKIAYLSKGIVIIEGFIDLSTDDIASNYARDHWSESLVSGFTKQEFMESCSDNFSIEAILPSPTSPARKFIVLKVKRIPVTMKHEVEKNPSTMWGSYDKNIKQCDKIIYKWFKESEEHEEEFENIWRKQFFISRMSSYLCPINCLILDENGDNVCGYAINYVKGDYPAVNYLVYDLPKIETELFRKGIVLIDASVVNFICQIISDRIHLQFIDYDFLSIQLHEDFVEDDRLVKRYCNRRVRLLLEYQSIMMDQPLEIEKIKLWR